MEPVTRLLLPAFGDGAFDGRTGSGDHRNSPAATAVVGSPECRIRSASKIQR